MAYTKMTSKEVGKLCLKAKRELLDARKRKSEEYLKTPIGHKFLWFKWQTFPKYGFDTRPQRHIYNGVVGLYAEKTIEDLLDMSILCDKVNSKSYIWVDEKESRMLNYIKQGDYSWIL